MPVEKQTILAFECKVGDVEDPDLVADYHISGWQQGKMGSWLIENCDEKVQVNRIFNEEHDHHEYQVFVTLSGPALTAYHLMTNPGI